jgi:hypothetical protein
MNVRFTLVAEGTTDEALMPILSWAIRADRRVREIDAQFAPPSFLPPAREGLTAKIRRATELFPAELFFVHRDADTAGLEVRREEILSAAEQAGRDISVVPVVPVRMTEAWLLIDEAAIRMAADNPKGSMALGLPPRIAALEDKADPKTLLYQALTAACDQRGRRLARFLPRTRTTKVANGIKDFASLRQLNSFRVFEQTLKSALDRLAGSAG